ncbi:MAG TPA: class II fructose-bisphosphate aldolase [Candidatus Krumholzibacteria bacterium]|nr:class II fructose-bisphosphate aldolase [Candidatus Krumholzibacteria bacterium]
MALVPMRVLLDHAAENDYGVGAFNVNNMEQIQAIMEAARETNSPVIVQASRGARAYSDDNYLRHLMLAAAELNPKIPIAMHQDHGNSPKTCFSAIEMGFTSVMMDGSLQEDGKTPSSYEYNVEVTQKVVEAAHAKGVTVEAELGCLGGIEDGHGAGLSGEEALAHLTDPAQAEEFVAQTGCDALAVAIGTSHGAYKFTKKPTGEVLKMEIIAEIHRRLPNTHMVMHGSSSVPKELVDIINQYGGEIRETYGVPVEEIQEGIRHGVRKINVDTDNRLAITGAIRKVFAEDGGKFDPRDYLKPARAAMKEVVKARMIAFGQAGNADKVPALTLDDMKRRYHDMGSKVS